MAGAEATIAARALARARMLCDLQRWGEAITAARDAVGSSPDTPDAWCVLARAHLGPGDGAPGLDAAGRAVVLAPGDEWPHRLASVALLRLDRPDDALRASLTAVHLAPFAWQCHVRVAYASSACSMPDQAAAAAAKAVELAPNEADAWDAVGPVGAVAISRKRWKDAEAAYRGVLRLDPQDVAAHHGLARAGLRGRWLSSPARMADAASGFARTIPLDPREKASRHNLEVVLRNALNVLSYVIFLLVFLVFPATTGSGSVAPRLVAAVVLGTVLLFGAQFVVRLAPPARAHFVRILRLRSIAVAVALDALAIAAVIAAVSSPEAVRPQLTGVSVCGALAARLILYVEARRTLGPAPEA